MKRRIITLLLCLLLLAGLCGCGKEKQAEEIGTCTLLIDCSVLLEEENARRLPEETRKLVPENGLLFPETEQVLYSGDTAFSVLQRAARENGIQMEYVESPGYGSAYVEGIGNIYEFDCGDTSGWLFSVNGIGYNYAADKVALQNGDKVVWSFTCTIGDSLVAMEE